MQFPRPRRYASDIKALLKRINVKTSYGLTPILILKKLFNINEPSKWMQHSSFTVILIVSWLDFLFEQSVSLLKDSSATRRDFDTPQRSPPERLEWNPGIRLASSFRLW